MVEFTIFHILVHAKSFARVEIKHIGKCQLLEGIHAKIPVFIKATNIHIVGTFFLMSSFPRKIEKEAE